MWWRPDWGAPAGVGSAMSIRLGGVSEAPFDSANLAFHVGDVPERVAANRGRLQQSLGVQTLAWFEQVHGVEVAHVAGAAARANQQVYAVADAAITRERGVGLAIMVADCLPVLFATSDGHCVGAAHAGWRGLAGGVLERCVAALGVRAAEVHCWLGPAISGAHYEIDEPVRRAFAEADAVGFKSVRSGHYRLDLVTVATARLSRLGVASIASTSECAFERADRYFSHRRSAPTGRCAAVVWLTS